MRMISRVPRNQNYLRELNSMALKLANPVDETPIKEKCFGSPKTGDGS